MDNDIENIFSRQAEVLPDEVRRFVASGSWEGSLEGVIARYNLSEDDTDALRTEIALVLAGLVHPNEFRSALGGEMTNVGSATLDAIVGEVGFGIFAPIRPALERFFAEQEEGEETEHGTRNTEHGAGEKEITAPSQLAQTSIVTRSLERMPDVAPANLPTGEPLSAQGYEGAREEVPLIPPLAPKMRPSDDVEATESEGTHHFEEKMKKVFTGGTADMGELALSPTPSSISRITNDPYREPIE